METQKSSVLPIVQIWLCSVLLPRWLRKQKTDSYDKNLELPSTWTRSPSRPKVVKTEESDWQRRGGGPLSPPPSSSKLYQILLAVVPSLSLFLHPAQADREDKAPKAREPSQLRRTHSWVQDPARSNLPSHKTTLYKNSYFFCFAVLVFFFFFGLVCACVLCVVVVRDRKLFSYFQEGVFLSSRYSFCPGAIAKGERRGLNPSPSFLLFQEKLVEFSTKKKKKNQRCQIVFY